MVDMATGVGSVAVEAEAEVVEVATPKQIKRMGWTLVIQLAGMMMRN